MRVIDRLAEFEYVLKEDTELEVEEQTTWVLQGLPYDIQQALEARVSPKINMKGNTLADGEEGYREALNTASVSVDVAGGRTALQFDILRQGIVSVSNLLNKDGEEIVYPGPKTPPLKLKNWFAQWIGSDTRTELANVIIEGSTVTEEDAKN